MSTNLQYVVEPQGIDITLTSEDGGFVAGLTLDRRKAKKLMATLIDAEAQWAAIDEAEDERDDG
jgi:hypothetical protein